MKTTFIRCCVSMILCLYANNVPADGVVVIGHANVPKLDALTIQKLFTGRIVKLDGMSMTVVNAPPANPVRSRFLQNFLHQDEEKYVAYWTVRRFIGKGLPPRDIESPSEIISFVQSTPGAIGYIDSDDVKPGINILNRK